MQTYPIIGVIDLGTNTFHLIIAKVFPTRFEILYKEKIAVRIGEGGIDDNLIVEAAEARAMKTLKHFRKRLDEYKAISVRALATSAFRNASNAAAVMERVNEETGIQIEVIDGLEEARYIYKGVKQSLTFPEGNSVIMDIGGGSVEFIMCNKEGVLWEHSFEIGGQRLMNRFHGIDPIPHNAKEELESFLTEKLDILVEAFEKYKPQTLIGASGSFDTLIDIQQHKEGHVHYLDSHAIAEKDLLHIIDSLVDLDREGRLMIPGMIEMRASMIVVAGLLIKYICSKNTFKQILTSRFALKEGALYEERANHLNLE